MRLILLVLSLLCGMLTSRLAIALTADGLSQWCTEQPPKAGMLSCVGYVGGVIDTLRQMQSMVIHITEMNSDGFGTAYAIGTTFLNYCPNGAKDMESFPYVRFDQLPRPDIKQVILMFLHYVREHPEDLHHEADELVIRAMREAWPCSPPGK